MSLPLSAYRTRLVSHFCVEALKDALDVGRPEIFNTDQGVQYTSSDFVSVLVNAEIQISMDWQRFPPAIFLV